ncbi:MAG: hypothetical protein OEY52_01565 [Gammaproteobacteria bacterium]|nr:hypothetical protein [Gammaproteobacteria bacterium]
MSVKNTFLTFLLWIGLPGILIWIPPLLKPGIDVKAYQLFLFYLLFSWSIALLAFLLETSRQKLLQQDNNSKIWIRLFFYSSIALLIALFTSPWFHNAQVQDIGLVLVTGIVYCLVGGRMYLAFYRKNQKK